MPRNSLRRHGARTVEKHHELAALHELPPTRTTRKMAACSNAAYLAGEAQKVHPIL
jgi:hypothetical protein